MKIPLISNDRVFRYHNIGKILSDYDCQYNLGWGNLDKSMMLEDVAHIDVDTDMARLYTDSKGTDELVAAICNFINERSEIKVTKSNILVTNGSTNGILLAAEYYQNYQNINRIFLQEPSYDTAVNIFRSLKLQLKTFRYDDYETLLLESNALTYLMLKYHNPTGHYTNACDRAKLIDGLLANNMYIIEDDAYGLFDSKDTIDITLHKNYLYAGSFSKYIYPGLRIGFIVGEAEVIEKLSMMQRYHNSFPSYVGQTGVLSYLRTGKIKAEINHKIDQINKNRKIFEDNLSSQCKSMITNNSGGFYYWLSPPDDISSEQVFYKLLEHGIFVIPGAVYSIDESSNNFIRVSVSNINSKNIADASKIISEVFEEMRKEK